MAIDFKAKKPVAGGLKLRFVDSPAASVSTLSWLAL